MDWQNIIEWQNIVGQNTMRWPIVLFVFLLLICLSQAPELRTPNPRVPKSRAPKSRAPRPRAPKSHAIQSAGAVAPSQIVYTQLVAVEKAKVSLMIEEDRQWRQETHNALVVSQDHLKTFYNIKGKSLLRDLPMLIPEVFEGSNESFESLRAASRVDTPERRALTIVETNPERRSRKISIKYRPLRSSVEK